MKLVGLYNENLYKDDAFKDIIAGARTCVEPKGVDLFFVHDTRNFCATTKSHNSFKIELGCRRQ